VFFFFLYKKEIKILMVAFFLLSIFYGDWKLAMTVVLGFVQLVIHFRKFKWSKFIWIITKNEYYSKINETFKFPESTHHITESPTLDMLWLFVDYNYSNLSWDFVFLFHFFGSHVHKTYSFSSACFIVVNLRVVIHQILR
jgi:hypothetical protein